jgi:hypothetical protein
MTTLGLVNHLDDVASNLLTKLLDFVQISGALHEETISQTNTSDSVR